MARQLEAAGESVTCLVLMDIPAPQPGNGIGEGWSEVSWLVSIAKLLDRLGGCDLGLNVAARSSFDGAEPFGLLQDRWSAQGRCRRAPTSRACAGLRNR